MIPIEWCCCDLGTTQTRPSCPQPGGMAIARTGHVKERHSTHSATTAAVAGSAPHTTRHRSRSFGTTGRARGGCLPARHAHHAARPPAHRHALSCSRQIASQQRWSAAARGPTRSTHGAAFLSNVERACAVRAVTHEAARWAIYSGIRAAMSKYRSTRAGGCPSYWTSTAAWLSARTRTPAVTPAPTMAPPAS